MPEILSKNNKKYVHVYVKMLHKEKTEFIIKKEVKKMKQETYKYSYKVQEKLLSSLCVYNVGYQKCEPNYQWGPGIRDHYLIHHVICGCGYYAVHGRIYELKAGDSFLVYPGTEIRYWADQNQPWEYAWVGFAGNDAVSILRNTDFSREKPILEQAAIRRKIEKRIMNIYKAKGNSFENIVAMTGALYTLLAMLMEESHCAQEQKNHQMAYVEKAVQYVSERYSYPITVEEIAAYTGVSRSHLFRLFQKNLGTSPKEYLTNCRLRQACQLLKETDLSVTAISHSVGFENNLYFSKAFKKVFHVTPTQYRTKDGTQE